jgi:Asp-tRNA(Asn)/Glu-tRNA(Gln) amidotransferase A subunit family amidase
MKKFFWIIAFAAIALTAVSKAEAQDYSQIGREMEQAATDLRTGRITVQVFQQRVQEIEQKASGLPVHPEVQALSQMDIQAVEKLTAEFHGGRISLQEFQQRVHEIYQRANDR